jgi:hypothetical protein
MSNRILNKSQIDFLEDYRRQKFTPRYAADTRKLEKIDKPFEINGAGGGNRTERPN